MRPCQLATLLQEVQLRVVDAAECNRSAFHSVPDRWQEILKKKIANFIKNLNTSFYKLFNKCKKKKFSEF